uniref:Transmembrane protein n=1 Tax=Macrostomum lignano TaxID=282301 RepID=A0A1I8GCJ1_9PLAT
FCRTFLCPRFQPDSREMDSSRKTARRLTVSVLLVAAIAACPWADAFAVAPWDQGHDLSPTQDAASDAASAYDEGKRSTDGKADDLSSQFGGHLHWSAEDLVYPQPLPVFKPLRGKRAQNQAGPSKDELEVD